MAPTRNSRKSRKEAQDAQDAQDTTEPKETPEAQQNDQAQTASETPGPPVKKKKVPRPPNAWILYRKARLRQMQTEPESARDAPARQSDISIYLARMWRQEDPAIRNKYEKEAEIAKAKHKEKYPDYKYRPMSKEQKAKERAEQTAAAKKAKQEAKAAAKASGRKASSSGNGAGPSTSPGETSAVRLEDLEPIPRGSGPSPPIDSDDDLSWSSSTPSIPSEGEAPSSQSPFLVHPPYPSANPIHAPEATYALGFLSTDVGSVQTTISSLPNSSTPSDSPPSYSDAENWQHSQTNIAAQLQGWNVPQHQASMLLPGSDAMQGIDFDMPELQSGEQAQQWLAQWQESMDPSAAGLSCMPGLPPEEVSLTVLAPPATVQGQPNSQELFNENDFLGPGLNMAEFYEDVEDVGHAAARISQDAAAVVNGSGPLSFEEVAAFIDQNPQVTERSMDPSYALLAAEAANAYPHRVYNYFPEPYALDPPPAPPYPGEIVVEPPAPFPEAIAPAQTIAPSQTMLSSTSAGPSQTAASPFSEATSPTYAPSSSVATSQGMDASQAMVDWFNSPMMSFLQGPLTSPPPSTAASTPAPGSAMVPDFSLPQEAHSAGAFFQFQQVVAAPEYQQVVPTPEPVEAASAPQPSRRYVPPSGAGLAARRRVGQRYTAPPRRLGVDTSETCGSGSHSA